MKKIFVVVYEHGRWDDAVRESVRAYSDETLANNFIAHKNKAIRLACDFAERLAKLPEKFVIPAFNEKEPRKDDLPEWHRLRQIQQTHPDKAARKKSSC